MKIIVEEEINAGYLYLNYDKPEKTVEFGDCYLVDLNDKGAVSGLEVLDIRGGIFDSELFRTEFSVPPVILESIERGLKALKESAISE